MPPVADYRRRTDDQRRPRGLLQQQRDQLRSVVGDDAVLGDIEAIGRVDGNALSRFAADGNDIDNGPAWPVLGPRRVDRDLAAEPERLNFRWQDHAHPIRELADLTLAILLEIARGFGANA